MLSLWTNINHSAAHVPHPHSASQQEFAFCLFETISKHFQLYCIEKFNQTNFYYYQKEFHSQSDC